MQQHTPLRHVLLLLLLQAVDLPLKISQTAAA
jgi:hypothetical protein